VHLGGVTRVLGDSQAKEGRGNEGERARHGEFGDETVGEGAEPSKLPESVRAWPLYNFWWRPKAVRNQLFLASLAQPSQHRRRVSSPGLAWRR
jgi:hypothetical protein